MKVEKIHHVAIRVRDINEATKFFADLFETEFCEFRENTELNIRSTIDPVGIEIVQPLTSDGVMARTLERRGEGLTLISLKVADAEKAVAEMKSRGIRQIGRVREGLEPGGLFHPKDLYGVLFELVEK